MAHKHSVYDTDAHFSIDAVSRFIKNVSSNKRVIVQGDHNSERFSFELPRYIEGHDMSECNKIYVNFNNIGTSAKEQNKDCYEVDDLEISADDENLVVCTWLISGNATKYAGTLSFNISFRCETDDKIDYSWNTAICSDFFVVAGYDCGVSVALEYSDILTKWKAELFAAGYINAEDMQRDIASLQTDLAAERNRIDLLSNYVTPQMFGAIGDGANDDTAAIQRTVNYANEHNRLIIFPKGKYLISSPIIVPSGLDISGSNAVIYKNNTTTTTINETSINTVFVLTGSKTFLHDICIQGDVDNGVDGITFDENAFMLSISRVTLLNCRKCFNDIGGLFMAEFDRVHCRNSLNAFVFDTNRDKTSMTFKNCWAENCGQAYYMNRCQYTNLISCGADYCNAGEDSPYTVGYGEQESRYGVFQFSMCRAVTMNGCGVENSWGNGAVCCVASYLTINGMVCTNVKSKQVVNPSARAVGMIVHNSEASRIIINSLFTNTDFENTYVSENYPDAEQYLIAYNYGNDVYGDRGSKGIIASGLHSYSAPLLGGCGNYDKECLLMDEHGEIVIAEKYLDIVGRKIYPVRNLTATDGSDKLTIPFNSQSNANRVHLIRAIGISNKSNSNIPNAFEFTLEIASLNIANHATLISASHDNMSVATDGMNAIITLPATYTSLNISIETMSVKENLINLDSISLGA